MTCIFNVANTMVGMHYFATISPHVIADLALAAFPGTDKEPQVRPKVK